MGEAGQGSGEGEDIELVVAFRKIDNEDPFELWEDVVNRVFDQGVRIAWLDSLPGLSS